MPTCDAAQSIPRNGTDFPGVHSNYLVNWVSIRITWAGRRQMVQVGKALAVVMMKWFCCENQGIPGNEGTVMG
jgi:hypothetical protein